MVAEIEPAIRRHTEAGKASTAWGTGGRDDRLLRVLARHGLPVFAVVVVTAVVATIALYVYDSNRRGALALSNDLLGAIDRRIAIQMSVFLSPAEQFLETAREVAGDLGVFGGGTATELLALHTLPKIRQIAGYSYADSEGNFLYVVRKPEGGYDTKLIDRRAGGHRVTWTRRDATGKVVATVEDPSDTFDPRTRPWYEGAISGQGSFWSEPYVFFTLRQPGITHSLAHYDEQKRLTAVSGADIELTSLAEFLKQLEIGVNGKAIIVDDAGRVVAFPGNDWLRTARAGQPLPRLDELGDPLLTRVYNRLRVEGYGRKVIDISGRRVVVSSEPLKLLTGRNWTVLIVVPESDFVGFVAASGWAALAMLALVVAITLGLAAALAWRSMRSERQVRAARARQQSLEAWATTFAELAASPDMVDPATTTGVRKATERAAETCDAKRVSVWHLAADGRRLACEDCYDRAGRAHTSGMELHGDELPELFTALADGSAIDTTNADRDVRTVGLAELYLDPLGTEGVHISPVRFGERLVGMLLVEDPAKDDNTVGLAQFYEALASLLALRFRPLASGAVSSTRAEPVADAPPPGGRTSVDLALADRKVAFDRTLLHRSISVDKLAGGRIDLAVVSVVKLPDWLSTGQRAEENAQATRMDDLVEEVRALVEGSGLDYAALLDDIIVLAAFSADPAALADTARLAALAAIALRDRLVDLTARWGDGSEFRLAIDIGPIMASSATSHPAGRNLWGGAIAIAKILATTGGRRAITTSEVAYRVLSSHFLFRQLGTFFLPETGAMRTFVLVGEL